MDMDKIKVIFVDDDIALGKTVNVALKAAGYDVYYSTSLIEINAVVEKVRPNIMVLDVEIGSKDGIEEMAQLKKIAPDVPVIFVSSHVDRATEERGLKAGGMLYLRKPFDIERLQLYIDRYAALSPSDECPIGMFTLCVNSNELKKGTETVKRLTTFECKLLRLLAINKNKPVKREDLEKEIWGDKIPNDLSLNNYILKTRKYLQDDAAISLETIHKVGYKLCDLK